MFRVAFARIVTHYWSLGRFLGPDGALLAEAGRLAGIPGALVQGRLDFGNLVGTPWLLDARLAGRRLHSSTRPPTRPTPRAWRTRC